MISRLILSALLMVGAQASISDTVQRIEMKPYWGGYRFTVDEKKVSTDEVLKMMLPIDSAAHFKMKKSKANNIFSTMLGGFGGFLIGWPIGTLVAGKDPQWSLAIVGAGLAVISIPISNKAKKQANDALDLYNSKVTTVPVSRRLQYHFVMNASGLTLILTM